MNSALDHAIFWNKSFSTELQVFDLKSKKVIFETKSMLDSLKENLISLRVLPKSNKIVHARQNYSITIDSLICWNSPYLLNFEAKTEISRTKIDFVDFSYVGNKVIAGREVEKGFKLTFLTLRALNYSKQ